MTDLFGNQEIRLLFFKQPFGSLMIPTNHYDYKSIETRVWSTSYHGLILICTSLKGYKQDDLIKISGLYKGSFIECVLDWNQEPTRRLCGYAIAIGELVNCRRMRKEDERNALVKFNKDLFSWEFSNVKRIEPFKIKGGLGLIRISDEVRSKIKVIA